MKLLNKLLCFIGWRTYAGARLVPTGEIDSLGCQIYWLIAIRKCKHCGRVKK